MPLSLLRPYVYLTCPQCRKRILEPFPRGQLSVYIHKTNDCMARLITRTHPESHQHEVHQIPRGTRIEDVLEEYAA